MTRWFLVLFFAFAAPAQAAGPVPVVASFSIIGDIVTQIGGDAVKVTTLVGPDADAHAHQPSPEDAKALAQAKLVFVNGLGFEGWMARLIEASGSKAVVVTVSEGITPRRMTADGATAIDPHAWQNLANGRIYARNIAAALERAVPAAAAAIAQRATAYDAALAAQDAATRAALAAIPAARRKVVTSHDAFGYFGDAYGVTFLAPVGIDTEAEPSAQGIAQLISQIKSEGVKRLFVENMANGKLIAQIAKDTGATLGGALYSDALSAPDGPAASYRAMFENNVAQLTAAMRL